MIIWHGLYRHLPKGLVKPRMTKPIRFVKTQTYPASYLDYQEALPNLGIESLDDVYDDPNHALIHAACQGHKKKVVEVEEAKDCGRFTPAHFLEDRLPGGTGSIK